MGCTNTKVHPVNFDPVPQAKETWFERKVKRRSGKVKQNLLRCLHRDSNLKTRKIAWPEQPRSVKTTQNNEDAFSVKTTQSNEDAVSVKTTQNIEDAFSVKTTQSNEDAVSVKTTQSAEDALSVKCTLSNEDAVSVKTTQSKEDALSVKCTLSNEDEISVKTTQSNEDALSGDSSFSDDVSDVSTLTTESESSNLSEDVSDVSTLTTESESSSLSEDVSDVSTLTTESDTETSTSSGSFESVIDLPVSPPKPSRGQTTPVPKTLVPKTLAPKTREEILLKNIARAGFQIDPVPRDGDCFFGAAARQLGRGEPRIDTTALQLRKDLVHHIRAHSEKFCVAVPGGFWAFQQELDRLARRGHWCSDVADVLPIALADFTSREVVLITSTDMQVMVLPPEGEESGTPLVLAYLTTPGGEHYDAVRFVGG
ncbi:uncharacterized protein LOC118422495 [Branchiostoma floridae]|uniref:Small ribosomal subunit protein mS31 n=1 Tax=Branchiostoma floridae TaxID=7739 RepID=A0A9J7N0S4_BRAFL|nr:uncharacterized protein LOC118422495 [Branchiostoma floridae]XP_035686001.1 uncharacterized protein LOC118422495 [Branchiostoma floridae]XP_035686003.1 uncharacterized protein LOC118422495 [Branchiostoma floridae]XP_035686004.1 uncharacterized protein LOC118422495 [Branchiostoma floridae]XP_035686005.1 uncharacterized protein LOC118422495 [Branchiostoma floridae]XP_035686006.1 uncharacterized protein LOC118422495 [Branchiostoma floridae]XP_035686007.1 uncharacterized protein LOC118422495 [